ncbi:MAG TPA: HPr family phosphocarrier protein [Planctomycetota bacterium]|nr:HPr family phosphocarrier protein [Planctomycetota bacterium]OQC21846.1 MAG: Phosphocarrier protein HPr [Planctomycetes bacterium ADurb.Bin069]NMD36284.1 HPr family phosphocarrier protein [Planctomycetota bacterium]HNR98203.1 HPr family phosphocarrier protein [Planctomycetota bacterium]HNU24928.1 HPr family phosphocarrier protein [Planctomycetota bacterium]
MTKKPGALSGNDTAEAVVQIANRSGLHGRPTTMFVKLASRFKSAIKVHCTGQGKEVDGKSALAVLSLGMEYGKKLCIRAKGDDAREAVAALGALVRDKFKED